ncbi:potassium-transporting ATPase subunit F [Kyrpidia tusciae]|nr:potassium-transporting ATPase subunit F [Kyrpidia tusciae]
MVGWWMLGGLVSLAILLYLLYALFRVEDL